MLMQYFIVSYENINIETLSSSGKLKGFEKMNTDLSSEYKQHKKMQYSIVINIARKRFINHGYPSSKHNKG